MVYLKTKKKIKHITDANRRLYINKRPIDANIQTQGKRSQKASHQIYSTKKMFQPPYQYQFKQRFAIQMKTERVEG